MLPTRAAPGWPLSDSDARAFVAATRVVVGAATVVLGDTALVGFPPRGRRHGGRSETAGERWGGKTEMADNYSQEEHGKVGFSE